MITSILAAIALQWCGTTDESVRAVPRAVGPQTVFVAMLQYPDEGPIFTRDTVVQSVTIMCNYFHDYSYGATSLTPTVSQTFLMMPHPRDYYRSAYLLISQDANQAAVAAGYGDITRYDHIIYMMPFTHGFRYVGWAGNGPQRIWINNSTNPWLLCHEMGHNYGLVHAHRWLPCDLNNPVDPCGTTLDYGDCHDMMGHWSATSDFNPYEKNRMGWITTGKITNITQNGVYRIHRFDSPQSGIFQRLAITIPQPVTSRVYWIVYRYSQIGTQLGADVMWTDAYASTLIDYHAITTQCNGDTTLPVGATLRDHNLSITPTQIGGVAPDTWVDVRITFL